MSAETAIRSRRGRGQRRTQAPPARGRLRLERRADGQLWAVGGRDETPVRVTRCFPWSDPARFVSLRDPEDEEVALLREPAQLDSESRRVLEAALAEAGFVLEIQRIDEVEEEIEIRSWKVRTHQGPRSFQTKRDEWPRPVPGGGLLVRDVAGDLFYVRDPEALDPRSRELLWVFVD
jgi:hypothetical protein